MKTSTILIRLQPWKILLIAAWFICYPINLFAQDPQPSQPESEAETKANPQPQEPPKDWVREYLADDPLVGRPTITLEDIRDGIKSPRRRDTVISQHFNRVTGVSENEKIDFLKNALSSEFMTVQRQAAVELQAMGELEAVVSELLLEFLKSEDASLRRAAVIGLERMIIPASEKSDLYWKAILEGLGESDDTVAKSAARQLKADGVASVPSLLNALKSSHPRPLLVAETLAEIIDNASEVEPSKSTRPFRPMESEIIGEKSPDKSMELGPELPGEKTEKGLQEPPKEETGTTTPAPTIGKGSTAKEQTHTARNLEPKQPTLVRVYFGTNRELIDRPPPSWSQILPYPFMALLLAFSLFIFLHRGADEDQKPKGCLGWSFPAMIVVGIIWSIVTFRGELQQHWRLGVGPSFGPHRDAAEKVHYGTCDVSIPPRHKSGEVERPIIGPENEEDHVVLKSTEELEAQAFFELVRTKVAELPRDDRSCFVFIHGFNVDFENAARRTAQIHYDLKFEGIPIFFSWPSRAKLHEYFSDRNEIEFSRYVIKQFLIDVAEKVKADRIHVIAHSMGADATCRAIAELGERGKIFDQIVLAAPDIDREVFRVQIAPRLTKTANRTTLYCSKNDLALIASRSFNDGTRAGDSSQGALVLRDVDTVDASEIDTDLLGHSYYGDCLPLLDDVNKLLRSALPPKDRQLRPWPVDEELIYWTLPESQKEKADKKNQPIPK